MEPLFRFLTDALNPLLVGILIAAPGPPTRGAWKFWGRCAVGVALAVLLAEAGKKYQIWPGHAGFPSGHTTLAASCAACLVLRDARWAGVAVPLALLMAVALVGAHYHDVPDVVGASVLGPTIVILTFRLSR